MWLGMVIGIILLLALVPVAMHAINSTIDDVLSDNVSEPFRMLLQTAKIVSEPTESVLRYIDRFFY